MRNPFLRWVFATLASPAAPVVLLVWLALAALWGLGAPHGAHPAHGALVQVPCVLLPFALLASALEQRASGLLARALVSTGLVVALLGAALAGGDAGVLETSGSGAVIESYDRLGGPAVVPAHLGGQLTVTDGPGTLGLVLGTRGIELGRAELPKDGDAERSLGPWRVHVAGVEPGQGARVARLRVRPRGADVVPATPDLVLREGQAAPLPGDGQLIVERLSPDYGRALGAGALVTVVSGAERRSDWVFVDAPDLDERLGTGKYTVTLLELVAEPAYTLGVRRAGLHVVALVGWAVAAVGVLLFGLQRRRRDAPNPAEAP